MAFRSFLSFTLLFSSLLLTSGCGEEEIASQWRNRDISIDGDASDWSGTGQFTDDDKGVRIAVFNDSDSLYLCLTTWNTVTQRQILMRGLTLWFYGEGDEKRTFGIEFPISKDPAEMKKMSEEGGSGEPGQNWDARDPEEIRQAASRNRAGMTQETVTRSGNEMMFGKTEDSNGHWMSASDAHTMGIDASLGLVGRVLILEMSVPLAGGALLPFPGGLGSGRSVGLGLEMGKMRMGERTEGPGQGGGPPGGGRPGGGTGGGPPGVGRGGMRGPQEEELEVWLKIRLAARRGDEE